MGGAHGRRHGERPGEPITLQAEVAVVHDAQLYRRQVKAIRNFLLSLAAQVGEPATSDAHVGAESARGDGLEGLIGPLEADVVRVVWAAKAPLAVREVLRQLNKSRAKPVRYTTVQTVMARLTRKQVLARSRRGRGHLYAAVASDAASIAVSRLLAQFGEAAIKPFVEQACREPRLRTAVRRALSQVH